MRRLATAGYGNCRARSRCEPPGTGPGGTLQSRVLPLFRTKEVGELIPELYLHGLARGISSWEGPTW